MVVAAILLAEVVTIASIIGGAITILGVYLVNKK
jgi:drug/metabolite transporter (DMT)-like permease